ncbi:uncharacterized protein B0H18DRAFT_1121283 [Fomitopsis serialis]|uniref:uncharacterized protein n=1 Tax=Fomitopsis serialis TaxID=139415 RepID=UPI0020080470|nr:uncharacterized protein B0H18DRAFT_1121283 [Neoantrodia serialis]KAH9921588.1 hypothetical protein B0H18DRAFT_1121283 [Neoantrodia serialis]
MATSAAPGPGPSTRTPPCPTTAPSSPVGKSRFGPQLLAAAANAPRSVPAAPRLWLPSRRPPRSSSDAGQRGDRPELPAPQAESSVGPSETSADGRAPSQATVPGTESPPPSTSLALPTTSGGITGVPPPPAQTPPPLPPLRRRAWMLSRHMWALGLKKKVSRKR